MVIRDLTQLHRCARSFVIFFFALSLLLLPRNAFALQFAAAGHNPGLVYVISLHGNVGKIRGEVGPSVTVEDLKSSLEKARKAQATVVVLDIEGPGGYVHVMQAMVKELLDAQTGGMRIVALPRDAFSAWSIVALSCKEILVTPTTRMGAAVSIRREGNGFVEAPEGKDAVSQKFAAPWKALWRQISELTKRPECIADAMQIQTNELWWSSTKGFAATRGAENDWEQLDNPVSVLCLTGSQMLRTKIADGEIRSLSELPNALHSPPGTLVKIAEGPVMGQVPKQNQPQKLIDNSRKACGKIRETLNLVCKISFQKQVSIRRVGGAANSTQQAVEQKIAETDAEQSTRICSELKKLIRHLPSAVSMAGDETLAATVEEIRQLLEEAIQHAKVNAIDATFERATQAAELMKECADQY